MLQIATTLCSYLSPTILFLLLNVVIATILLTSKPRNPTSTNAPLARAPSLVLDRLKSFNFKSFTLHAPEPETHSIAAEEHVVEEHRIDRSKSDTKPTAGEVLVKLPKKMKKSATMKSAFDHFESEEAAEKEREDNAVRRRPATLRERVKADDVEVDAKCDDFINRFKQQLKLQRMDSILRYKEMLNRGN